MSGAQYLRACSLQVGPSSGGNSLDLSQLHIKFNVTRATINTPQTATIRVYNLADATANTVFALSPSAKQPDGGQVQLSAGYESNFGLIFSGTIKQVLRGRENATDTFIDIIAADSDQAYNYGVVNTSLAAGWTQGDVAKQVTQSLSPFGITVGNNVVFSTLRAARGKVMFGMARAFGRKLAINNQCDWSIYNGQTTTVAKDGGLPGEAIICNSATGLIGFPQQTLDGIDLQTLLDPRMVPGSYLQINNKDILQFALSTDYTALQFVPSIENDGFYRIYWLERVGDTRGNDWFNHIICVGATSPPPITGTYIDTIGPT
jgi:hypothetical protein